MVTVGGAREGGFVAAEGSRRILRMEEAEEMRRAEGIFSPERVLMMEAREERSRCCWLSGSAKKP